MTPSLEPVAAARDDCEVCARCGRDSGSTPFCHLYRDGHRIVLCSAVCASTFLHPTSAESDYDRVPHLLDVGRSASW